MTTDSLLKIEDLQVITLDNEIYLAAIKVQDWGNLCMYSILNGYQDLLEETWDNR